MGKDGHKKSLQCEIYDRLASMECARIRKPCGAISFCNEVYEAVVVFHENGLMELSIEDRNTGDIPFYLHFEAREMDSVKGNLKAFFEFFKKKRFEKAALDPAAAAQRRPMRLLVSCTSGLTSSYFAYTMKNTLEKAGIKVTIDAVSFTEIDRLQEQYDYILLAPQIGYKLPEYREKYGDKVLTIDSRDFATYDTNRVINQITRRSPVRVA
ncbi:MAG: hypothetical protein HFG75_00680 [Hungatella sp.]|nr:hypothetical protein [Hungatella sp.]